MNYLETKTWEYLVDDEKTVISLLHGQGMTLASVATILGKKPYQIKRLNFQAIKMFRLFYEYFQEDPSKEMVWPFDPPKYVLDFINMGMLGDIAPGVYYLQLAETYSLELSTIQREVIKYLQTIKGTHLFNILREVDRYRRRFLPKDMQYPSPYRRKRNRLYKTVAKKIWGYDSFILHVKARPFKENFYIPYVIEQGYTSIKYGHSPGNLDLFTALSIPVFKDPVDAEQLGQYIYEYHMSARRTPQMGSKYVNDIRELFEKSLNYHSIFNVPLDSSKDLAWLHNDRSIVQFVEKKASKTPGAKRAQTDVFYNK